jgi:hypothetical protein
MIKLTQYHETVTAYGDFAAHKSLLAIPEARVCAITELRAGLEDQARRAKDAGCKAAVVWECGAEPQSAYVYESISEIIKQFA